MMIGTIFTTGYYAATKANKKPSLLFVENFITYIVHSSGLGETLKKPLKL